jgi:hypothetical protein
MAALGFTAFADSGSITPDRFWEHPTTIRKNISVQGGLDRVVLRKTFNPQQCYGQPYLDQKFWVDVSQSASTTPIDSNEPVVQYMLSGLDGGNMGTCYIDWKIKYHIQFFDLRTPSSSLNVQDDITDPKGGHDEFIDVSVKSHNTIYPEPRLSRHSQPFHSSVTRPR